jgi:hypothetical protein
MAVILRVELPTLALLVVVTDRTELSAAGFGANDPLVPGGRPLALSVTGALKPPLGVIEIV